MGLREKFNEAKSRLTIEKDGRIGLREEAPGTAKRWLKIQKAVNTLRKNIDKIEFDIIAIQKAVKAAGGEPNDWSIPASYATDNLTDVCDEIQKIIDKWK